MHTVLVKKELRIAPDEEQEFLLPVEALEAEEEASAPALQEEPVDSTDNKALQNLDALGDMGLEEMLYVDMLESDIHTSASLRNEGSTFVRLESITEEAPALNNRSESDIERLKPSQQMPLAEMFTNNKYDHKVDDIIDVSANAVPQELLSSAVNW